MNRPLITIPRGGRNPIQYTDSFLRAIADQYRHMTTKEIAEHHNVSVSTVGRWVKKARERGYIPRERKSPWASVQR